MTFSLVTAESAGVLHTTNFVSFGFFTLFMGFDKRSKTWSLSACKSLGLEIRPNFRFEKQIEPFSLMFFSKQPQVKDQQVI